jgi:uncharacterized protein involved in exopolysaccharide biosynthesis
MSTQHKDALAQGRTEGRIIRMYLEIVEANKPKRGRKRTADSITKRLAAIQKELTTADAIVKLRLTQERMNLTAELATKQLGSKLLPFTHSAMASPIRHGKKWVFNPMC